MGEGTARLDGADSGAVRATECLFSHGHGQRHPRLLPRVTQTQLTVTVEDRVWPAVTITAVVPLQHRVEYGDDVTDEHIPGSFSVRSTNTIVWFYELPTSGDSVEYERITQTIYGITDGGDGDTLDAYRDMFNQLDIWIARATSTRPSTITVTGQLEAVWEIGSLRADTTND